MADDQFLSFEDALDKLRLQEEELKRLVSEGEIRAFREGDTMRLRRTDVESLRAELSGGEVVGAQVGPVGFCATVFFGAGLSGAGYRQIVGGCVDKDNIAFV